MFTTIQLVFFDGEEILLIEKKKKNKSNHFQASPSSSSNLIQSNSLFGSRHLANKWEFIFGNNNDKTKKQRHNKNISKRKKTQVSSIQSPSSSEIKDHQKFMMMIKMKHLLCDPSTSSSHRKINNNNNINININNNNGHYDENNEDDKGDNNNKYSKNKSQGKIKKNWLRSLPLMMPMMIDDDEYDKEHRQILDKQQASLSSLYDAHHNIGNIRLFLLLDLLGGSNPRFFNTNLQTMDHFRRLVGIGMMMIIVIIIFFYLFKY